MTLLYTKTHCELREVVLKDKPEEMLEASPKGTVPVLVLPNATVLEESRDIMNWCLAQRDEAGWKVTSEEKLQQMEQLIDDCDGDFKTILDQYKYSDRHIAFTLDVYRHRAMPFLKRLDEMLKQQANLFSDEVCYADIAIFPFIRQFANVEPDWFDQIEYKHLRRWLKKHCQSDLFTSVMDKYPAWKTTGKVVQFAASA